jgi:hypothetical protein
VTSVSDYIPGYDPEPAEAITPSAVPAEPKHGAYPVSPGLEGYRGPGGLLRDEIRQRIRAAKPYSSVTVEVPEWDITVEVRSMTLGDRNDMAAHMVTKDGDGKPDPRQFYGLVLMTCTFDAQGQKVFGPEDIPWLNNLDAHILDKIAKPAMELNGFGEDEKAAEKRIEEEAGKSSATPTGESTTS